MIRVEVKQIVGMPDKTGWSQIHHFSGLEPDKKNKRGEMVLLISLEGMPEEAATSLGREITSRIYEEYYGNLAGSPMQQLEKALKRVGKERPVFITQKVKLTLLAMVVWRNFVYLGRFGEGGALLSRSGEVFSLLQTGGKELEVISGEAKEGDVYMLATIEFFSHLPSSTIHACLRTGDLNSLSEIILPLVHARKRQGKIAAVAVGVSLWSPEKKTLIPKAEKAVEVGKRTVSFKRKVMGRLVPLARKKNWQLRLAMFFLLLLFLSVFFGWQKNRQKQLLVEYDRLLAQAQNKLKAAESIKQLDPQGSLSLVEESLKVVDQMERLKMDKAQTMVVKQRAESLKSILGGGEKKAPEIFFDLSLLDDAAVGDDLFFQNNKLFVLDSASKKIFSISWPQKSTATVVSGDQVVSGQLATDPTGSKFYLLGGEGIFLLDKSLSEKVVEKDWGRTAGFATWLGNLYLLDTENNAFWKLTSAGSKFKKRSWLIDRPSWNWQSLVDFDIDGEVWFLDKTGRIYRFLSGRKRPFEQKSGLVKQAAFLRVAKKASRLVYWDEEQRQLWLLDKSGKFLARISLNLSQPTDLEIDDKGEAVFILKESKVYLVKLPQVSGEEKEKKSSN
jgi:hypothetical protein